jgi:hypothetical protein
MEARIKDGFFSAKRISWLSTTSFLSFIDFPLLSKPLISFIFFGS